MKPCNPPHCPLPLHIMHSNLLIEVLLELSDSHRHLVLSSSNYKLSWLGIISLFAQLSDVCSKCFGLSLQKIVRNGIKEIVCIHLDLLSKLHCLHSTFRFKTKISLFSCG